MLKRMLASLLSLAMIFSLSTMMASAQTGRAASDKQKSNEEKEKSKEEKRVAKLKKRVVEFGTNKTAVVRLKSGQKISGRVSEIRDDAFVVQSADQGQITSRDLKYGDVSGIKEKGTGKRVAGRVAIITGAVVGGVVLLILIAFATAD